MAIDVHTVSLITGSSNVRTDRLLSWIGTVSTAAGSGAGAAVTTAVSFTDLPTNYNVQATPSQDATCYITSKTTSGFNLVIEPRLASNTLAAGTVDILITA